MIERIMVHRKFNLGNYEMLDVEVEYKTSRGETVNVTMIVDMLADEIHKSLDSYKAKHK